MHTEARYFCQLLLESARCKENGSGSHLAADVVVTYMRLCYSCERATCHASHLLARSVIMANHSQAFDS